jgi:hypothetical protein
MNFPVEAMADLPDEQKQAFLQQLEHMQVRDRQVTKRRRETRPKGQESGAHVRGEGGRRGGRTGGVGGARRRRRSRAHPTQNTPNTNHNNSLRLYNALVERCFKECVDDFRSKNLDKTETACVTKCCEKFLNLSARTGLRFQELFTEMEKAAAAAASKAARR